MNGPIVFGSTWRNAMRRCRRPTARAASMYCISRIDSTLARMTRAARGMIGIEIAMTTLSIDGPSAADITSASTSSGSPCRMSSTRWVDEVGLAAGVAGQEPDDPAEDRAEQRRGDAHDERDARAVDDARVDVAAEVVGAEPVLGARRGQGRRGLGGDGIVGRRATFAKSAVSTMTTMISPPAAPERLLPGEAASTRPGEPVRRPARDRQLAARRHPDRAASRHSARAGRGRRTACPRPGSRG